MAVRPFRDASDCGISFSGYGCTMTQGQPGSLVVLVVEPGDHGILVMRIGSILVTRWQFNGHVLTY